MTVVADSDIPLAEQVFGAFGEVRRLPGADITADAISDADILVVRSVTRVDTALIRGSRLAFVGTATIGTDHIDQTALASHGITFAHAPGCNAGSVVEYVLASLLAALADAAQELRGKTVGIVGAGAIGGRLARRLRALRTEALINDPPREEGGETGVFCTLTDLLERSDVVSLHCPLTTEGPHPTRHLISGDELERMRPGAWLVNAARGPVVDNTALLQALERGRIGGAILDVWEGEPRPDPRLVDACHLATPHIAGYSVDGRVNGTLMIGRAIARWKGADPDPAWLGLLEPTSLHPPALPVDPESETRWLDALVRQLYDVRADSEALKRTLSLSDDERAAAFRRLRSGYPPRRSFSWYEAPGQTPTRYLAAVGEGLGLRVDQR